LLSDKLKEIRETTSDAVSIIRELGAPGVQDSLGKILETTKAAKEIVDRLREPEFVKNIENIRLTTQSIQEASTKIENTVREIKQTGVLLQAREAIKSANAVLDSFSSNKNFAEGTELMKATLSSIRSLIEELRLIAVSSKKTGSLSNVAAVINESTDMYRNIAGPK